MDNKAIYVPEGYNLVWGDDFDGNELDTSKWQLEAAMGPFEDLTLSKVPEIIKVEDSHLKINAIKLNEGEYAATYSVCTPKKMNFKYGYVEMKAKVPYKIGSWPSLWMKAVRGEDQKDSFVKTGKCTDYMAEVDIFEVFGREDQAIANIHKWYDSQKFTVANINYNAIKDGIPYIFENHDNLSDEYHIYAFEWTEKTMSMSIDGNVYATYDLSENMDAEGVVTDMSGFHDPMYLLMNNHVITPKCGFNWCDPISDSDMPMSYSIDWIYLYQKPDLGELYIAED